MSFSENNVLVVEDDPDWQDVYRRVFVREADVIVHFAATAEESIRLIDRLQFSVAFIDLALSRTDDRNVDGMRVMAHIRSKGDPTSIVVVTGRRRPDVLSLARDAIKKYDAFDTLSKQLSATELRTLLTEARAAFSRATSSTSRGYQILRGNAAAWDWDDRIMRATGVRGGAQGLYALVDKLVLDYTPLVFTADQKTLGVDPATGIASGEFLSRAVGHRVVVFLGRSDDVSRALREALRSRSFLGRYAVGELLREVNDKGVVGGILRSAEDEHRSDSTQ